MKADFTYDSDTDQFVVTLDNGTEVCRTRAPHRQPHRKAAMLIADAINLGWLKLQPDGVWKFKNTSKYADDDARVFYEEGFLAGEVQGMKLDSPLVEH